MSHSEKDQTKHPTVTEHPEQRRQEETGQEDASDASEVGQAPSQSGKKKQEHAA